MVALSDIYSLTDFQRKTREHIERLKETRRPEVLTVNGRAEIVVQDAAAYQDLLDQIEEAQAIIGIQRGLDSMRRGEGEPLADAIANVRRSVRERRGR